MTSASYDGPVAGNPLTDGPVSKETMDAWVANGSLIQVRYRMLRQMPHIPAPGSMLEDLDAYLPTYLSSRFLRDSVLSAFEHMSLWAHSVLTSDPEPLAFRPIYSLSRSAMDAAAQVLYVIDPDNMREARRRYIRLVISNLHEQRKVEDPTVKQADVDLRAFVAKDFGDADLGELGKTSQKFQQNLESVAPMINRKPDDLVRIWRAASGVTHGLAWPTNVLTSMQGYAQRPLEAPILEVLEVAVALTCAAQTGYSMAMGLVPSDEFQIENEEHIAARYDLEIETLPPPS